MEDGASPASPAVEEAAVACAKKWHRETVLFDEAAALFRAVRAAGWLDAETT